MIELLWQHTPYLAGGFAINVWISVVAMVLGTGIGLVLGYLRFRAVPVLNRMAWMGTNICRNVPSFVLLFYMASMVPSEIELNGAIVEVPHWIKATLALVFPVVGFASDQSLGFFAQRSANDTGAGETFLVAWMQYFLIILMASATASVIGADEIVGRANTLISQNESEQFMLAVYLYASLWFLVVGLVLSSVMKGVLRFAALAE